MKGPKGRGVWPRTVTAGSVSVKVHRVKHATNKSGWAFVLTWRTPAGRETKKFADPDAALNEARIKAGQLAHGKVEAADIGAADRDELQAARRIAKARNVPLVAAIQEWDRARELSGDSLIPACESWSARKGTPHQRLKVGDVMDMFLKAKTKAGFQTAKNHGHIFEDIKKECGDSCFDAITPLQLNAWLEKREHPVTRTTFRKHVVVLWRWASKQGLLSKEIKTEA